MKSTIQMGTLCIVVLVLCCLDYSNSANSTTSPTSSSYTDTPKKVYLSNLTYSIVRRIRVGTTTTSSTSKSSRTRSNRKLNAKKTQAKRSSKNRKSNSRRARG
ncbi:uncharacterized protein LOC120446891 [Drosophila santomea]|uniref:uncharacterized protein LOC120446891 n=1 Tax=Drosophila santomea TaxID=129105 RepID=UPI0019531C42|nr:uncharacterized protein LOC120446891 [Drosophila santomea]